MLTLPAPSLTLALPAQVPTPTPTPTLEDLVERGAPCWVDAEQRGSLCNRVYDWTGLEWLAASSDWLIERPLTILLIIVVAFIGRLLLHRLISRLTKGAAQGTIPGVLARGSRRFIQGSPLLSERRTQRAETMGSVLKSISTGVVFTVAVLMILSELSLDIAPLIASAGILGIALGFGAQTLVKDFLSGIFLILEDQYGVGDVVDLGEATGAVEAVGLRVTRLRSIDGAVWYVRNGEILRVGNMSQGWARAVLDIGVSYGSDIQHVREVLEAAANDLAADEIFGGLVLEQPEVWGVEALAADSVVVRVVVKTVPLKQWEIARELRQRIKARFDAEGIELPFPQRTIWMRTEGPGATEDAPTAT